MKTVIPFFLVRIVATLSRTCCRPRHTAGRRNPSQTRSLVRIGHRASYLATSSSVHTIGGSQRFYASVFDASCHLP
jgi:hypothetical protein